MEAGQAVEEDAVGVMGHVHHVHGYAVGGEELDALFELSLFAHGNPNVGVDSVRTVNSGDIFGEFDLCAGGLCKLAHFFNKMILGEESLGSDADKVHTEFCGDDHEGVAHVVACITDINELDLVEGLGDVFHDGEAVCKNLSGMIQVGEAVPYGNARMLCEQLNGLLLEAAEFNAVIETAENLCGVLKGFLFAHLAVGKEGYMCAFVKRGNLESLSKEEAANNQYLLGFRKGSYSAVDSNVADEKGDEDNMWILVSKEDRDALLEAATEENPVDASYAIKMPNFNQREYEISGGWDNLSGEEYAWEHTNGTIYNRGSNNHDFAFEAFNQDPVDISQTIYDLKPGYYILSVQGYYRDCTEVDYTQAIAAGGYEPKQLANLFAWDANMNQITTPLVTIDQYANYAPGYGWNSNTSVGWIPNNPQQATNYFQVGAYKNSLLVQVGDDGVLTIGVHKEGGAEKDWVCLDNFRLTYLGTQTPTGINGVTDDAETVKDGKIYNLQGVQVKSATQRGIYIQNGKKFVVK